LQDDYIIPTNEIGTILVKEKILRYRRKRNEEKLRGRQEGGRERRLHTR
jgi:hypothetical protein